MATTYKTVPSRFRAKLALYTNKTSIDVFPIATYFRMPLTSGLRGDRGLGRVGDRPGCSQAELAQIDLPDQIFDFGLVDAEVEDLDVTHHRRGDLAGGKLEAIEPNGQGQPFVLEVAGRQCRTNGIHRFGRSSQLEVDDSIAGIVVLQGRQVAVVDDLAAVDDDDAIADVLDVTEVVGRQHH